MSSNAQEAPAIPDVLRSEVSVGLVPGTATQVAVKAREHAFTIDEPAGLGGSDIGANPVEHLLAALGSCQVISTQLWAQKLGLRIDGVDVELAGNIDLRGFFGLADDVRPGFEGIDVNLTIRGPEPAERYDELVAKVEEHCPVLDNLVAPVPVSLNPRVEAPAAV